MPIALEACVHHLRIRSAVYAEEDWIFGSTGVVKVRREEFHDIKLYLYEDVISELEA